MYRITSNQRWLHTFETLQTYTAQNPFLWKLYRHATLIATKEVLAQTIWSTCIWCMRSDRWKRLRTRWQRTSYDANDTTKEEDDHHQCNDDINHDHVYDVRSLHSTTETNENIGESLVKAAATIDALIRVDTQAWMPCCSVPIKNLFPPLLPWDSL